jgi:lysophospholipase L1-like esterase
MNEKCVCHINGYRLKDTEARQKATTAGEMANEKVSRKGDTMEGALDMGNHEIANVMNVQTRAVILREPGNGVDVTVEAMTEPGTVRFVCPKKGNRVIVRGVAPGVADTDAVNMAQVREMVGNGNGSDSGQNVSVFAGKTALFFGDSLTEQNYHYTKGYHQWAKEILGLASCKNYGVSGYKVSDVYNKVNAVDDSADIVFVMCGVNDQNFSVPLGAMGDTTTGTTYGALKLLCEKLKEKHPTSIIVFITPAYQTKYPHSSGVTSYEVSKAIREVCEKYAIPVYDNFALSGIYNTNLSVFTTDNCHWNDTAHEMVGKNLARFVSETFRYVYGATSGGNEEDPGGEEGGGATDGTVQPEYPAKTVEVTGFRLYNQWHVSLYATAEDLPSINNEPVTYGFTIAPISEFAVAAQRTGGIFCVDTVNDLLAGYTEVPLGQAATVTDNQDGTYTVSMNKTVNKAADKAYWMFPACMTLAVGDKFTISDAYIKVGDRYCPIHTIGSAFVEETCIVTDAG